MTKTPDSGVFAIYNRILYTFFVSIIERVEQIEDNLSKLLNKAEIWQLLFDECPVAIACFDSSMNFHIVNTEFVNLTGFQQKELIGKNMSMVIPPKFKNSHKDFEKSYVLNPQKLSNRHGTPTILNKKKKEILVDIDLSFFDHMDKKYYIAFLRRK